METYKVKNGQALNETIKKNVNLELNLIGLKTKSVFLRLKI